jgi:hypothetical protein
MNGKKCMCIWDSYPAHETPEIIELAKKLDIELLQVPKGMTPELQPLDYKINGPYKMKMNSHWIRNRYNENENNYHLNLCETVLTCYDDLKPQLITHSFSCLD